MPSVIGRTRTRDGISLLTRRWPVVDGWASVLLVHGLGEHSGRYEHVGERLSTAGIAVDAFDLRGTGGSEGRRGDVERWSDLHDDLEARLEAVRSGGGSGPVALYGHSMGALIVAGYCLGERKRPRPDLVVLSAPGLDATFPSWKRAMAITVGRVVPTRDIALDLPAAALSRDPSVGARMLDDPGCVKTVTARFGAEGLREQARVRGLARGGLGVPTLVLHGLDDRLVPHRASEAFDGAPGVDRRTYAGLRHELHNEPEGLSVVDDVIAWLRERATLLGQPNTASGERRER
jgi:alpha-beta hydrolase superfamily lysophospholipase